MEKKYVVVVSIFLLLLVSGIFILHCENAVEDNYSIETNANPMVKVENGYFNKSSYELVKLLNKRAEEYNVETFNSVPQKKQIIASPGYEEDVQIVNTVYDFYTQSKDVKIRFISVEIENVDYGGNINDPRFNKTIDTVAIMGWNKDTNDIKYRKKLKAYYRMLCNIYVPAFHSDKFIDDYGYDWMQDGIYFRADNSRIMGNQEYTFAVGYLVMSKPDIADEREYFD